MTKPHPFNHRSLFVVRVVIAADVPVLATSIATARNITVANLSDYILAEMPNATGTQVNTPDQLTTLQTKSKPYGYKGHLTCEEILRRLDKWKRSLPVTRAELEACGQIPLVKEVT